MAPRIDVPRGTLDMMILKILDLGPLHGFGLSSRLEQVSDGTFRVNPGSLFPALHRMDQAGWIRGSWQTTENNRRAKLYAITAAGRRRLGDQRRAWQQVIDAVGLVMATR